MVLYFHIVISIYLETANPILKQSLNGNPLYVVQLW